MQILMLANIRGGRTRFPQLHAVTRRRVLATYEKKTPLEHVLLRPGMYIGQVEQTTTDVWLFDPVTKRMSKDTVTYSPALLKIFDEILVNAADNKQRDIRMSSIDIDVTRLTHGFEVSVTNDGKTLPTTMHPVEGVHIPELVFGHLLTGSNFNDSENRLTGGSHGYGAKLTNIFSKQFSVEVQDGEKGVLYQQSWNSNMGAVAPPTISNARGNNTYTKVTFQPDLSRFGGMNDESQAQQHIDQIIRLFQRRALDVAACIAPTQVRFNVNGLGGASLAEGNALPPVSSFEDYVRLFQSQPPAVDPGMLTATENGSVSGSTEGDSKDSAAEVLTPDLRTTDLGTDGNDVVGKIVSCAVNPRWEVAVGLSNTGSFKQMAFVNSVWTARGGTHVNYIAAQLTKAIEAALAKRGVTATAAAIRSKLMVFINCQIENPSFDGQTKDALNSKPADFGSVCNLPDKFLTRIYKETGILESIIEDVAMREHSRLVKRTKGSKRQMIDVPKLEDAHAAGGPRSLECTLILTEGDSAKALAVSGLEVVGRELYGVMPLRGKVLNVRCATRAQVYKNEEFLNLCKALGLDFENKYEKGLEGQGLRYGRVMIMCDQDTDGSHIKGLVINMFHHYWPALLKYDGFLQQFITPLVKARARTGSKEVHSFFSVQEFKQWQDTLLQQQQQQQQALAAAGAPPGSSVPASVETKYAIKYYKGLGTSTAAEGREYFSALARHRKEFQPLEASGADAIDLAFNRDRAAHRRDWIVEKHNGQAYLDPTLSTVSYADFIHKEFIHFSYADNHRSIPSVIDGLKPSQRKVLYGCFKKKLTKDEIKVVQLAGYIAEHTAYHHDEGSLSNTIINMAQDFVGSNNTPLLESSGQFGTRAQGGKDYASPRYVFTRLSPITRLLFPEEDDGLLHYEQEDGQTIEPRYFVPVIPTLLLNGSQGIGTGWSTSIPTYHLPAVVEHVRCRILGTVPSSQLTPYVEGFKGSIEPCLDDPLRTKFTTSGIIEHDSKTQLTITELPAGVWTDDYKRHLIAMVENGDIRSFREKHTTEAVRFEISGEGSKLQALKKKGFEKAFKLHSSISLSNMHAFNKEGKIQKYARPEEIVEAHYEVRRELYEMRKDALERKYAADEVRSRNKSRFISGILSGEIQVLQGPGRAATESLIVEELRRRGFADESHISSVLAGSMQSAADSDGSRPASISGHGGFGYLLDMPIYSLTDERSQQLRARAQEAGQALEVVRARSVEDLWLADLDKVSAAYEKGKRKESKQ